MLLLLLRQQGDGLLLERSPTLLASTPNPSPTPNPNPSPNPDPEPRTRTCTRARSRTRFPSVLASPAWAKTTAVMQQYGVAGMLLVASLPLILHPVIAFGMLSGASDVSTLAIVLGGRTLKYLVMAYVTAHAPHALRYFGVNQSLFDLAQAAATGHRAAPLLPPLPEGWRVCADGGFVRTSSPS